MNQSEFEAITCIVGAKRWKLRERVMIGLHSPCVLLVERVERVLPADHRVNSVKTDFEQMITTFYNQQQAN